MRRSWLAAATLLVLAAGHPAYACRIAGQTRLEDVRYADLVVVGRITGYRIIRDEAFRKKMLSNPQLEPELRKLYEGPESLLSDYARIDVEIDEVLIGKAPRRLTFTWDNSTFGEPETLKTGPWLIALREAASAAPPLRGPSAAIFPTPEPELPTLLQAPCAPPILFEADSDAAKTIRKLLQTR